MMKLSFGHAGFAVMFTVIVNVATARLQGQPDTTGIKQLPLAKATELQKATPILPVKANIHPRIFFTAADIPSIKQRAQGPVKADWIAVQNARSLESAALSYALEQRDVYLDIARKRMKELLANPDWAKNPYDPNQNRDLTMSSNLRSLSFAYDVLYPALTASERKAIREQLARNSRSTAAYYVNTKHAWRYAHNHDYLPMVGLAMASYALYGEEPEADQWLKLSEVFLRRTLETTGADGWYFEGWDYWAYAVPALAEYAEARYQMTGTMDALSAPLLRTLPAYVRYMMLPGGREYFDFGDTHNFYVPDWARYNLEPYGKVSGLTWRQPVYMRGGRPGFQDSPGNRCPLHLIELIAARFRDSAAQELVGGLRLRGVTGGNSMWSLLWADTGLQAGPVESLPTGHYFSDHEVAIWRSGWDEMGTAVAVKCGPPLGHENAKRVKEIPDISLAAWHAHPDAGSFILFANGEFLATDTGYTQPKHSADHNTLLINGRGQETGGGFSSFLDVPYDRLDKIRMNRVDLQKDYMYVEADMTAAYPAVLEMNKIVRSVLAGDGCMLIWDRLEAPYPHDYEWLLHTDTDYEMPRGGGRSPAAPARYRTVNGNAALEVRFLHPTGVEVEVQETVVIAHQHTPRSEGPPQERGHHLDARQHAANAEYVTCLTWGTVGEPMPEVTAKSITNGKISVTVEKAGKSREMTMAAGGGSLQLSTVR